MSDNILKVKTENDGRSLQPARVDWERTIDRMVRIVVDDRERAGGVVEALRARADVALEIARLGVGDFLVEEQFVVERKTLTDLAVSVIDARWFKQCAAMAAGQRRGAIILEGSLAATEALSVSRDALQGALITASIFYGIPVLRSRDGAETCRLLVYLGRQTQRVAAGAVSRHGYRPKGRHARQLFVLQGLPGIGADRAERLLSAFGSVQRVANASVEELVSVDGIGPRTAAQMRWALT